MKKVICFSLWGDTPKYTIGAIKNADLALNVYPDWICRYYIGKSTPINVVEDIKKRSNTEILIMHEEGNWESMFWRFYAASDPSIDVMISRDADSRLDKREKEAVDEWLKSDRDFHIMRDHPNHAMPILGGMWGARNRVRFNLYALAQDHPKGDYWQVDQNFLKQKIYPLIKGNNLTHDEFFDKSPFPANAPARTELNFVGNAFTENDKMITDEDFILEKQRREHGV